MKKTIVHPAEIKFITATKGSTLESPPHQLIKGENIISVGSGILPQCTLKVYFVELMTKIQVREYSTF